jgi:hypothetical protein
MRYADHLHSVQDAWAVLDAAVEILARAVEDVDDARGLSFTRLRTRQRVTEIGRHIEALVTWEQERPIARRRRPHASSIQRDTNTAVA